MKHQYLIHIKYLDLNKNEIVINYLDDKGIHLFYLIKDTERDSSHLFSPLNIDGKIVDFFEKCEETYYYLNYEKVNNTITYDIDEKKPTIEKIRELVDSMVYDLYNKPSHMNKEEKYYYDIVDSYYSFFHPFQQSQIDYFIYDVCHEKIKHDKTEEYFCRRLIGRDFIPYEVVHRDNIIDEILNK